tara:strand:- start:251 stop:445 length:195 start_codon:yes stop_codon:yes gene_type:complete
MSTKFLNVEIKKTTVNYGNVEVKDLKELDNLYSEGAIDEIVSDYVSKIDYEYYLNGKKIKTIET